MRLKFFDRATSVGLMIDEMRETVRDARQRGDERLLRRHRFQPPPWVEAAAPDEVDPIAVCVAPQATEILAKSGVVVWARLVQANVKCFKRRRFRRSAADDHPAGIFYSPHFDGDVLTAEAMARELFKIKGSTFRFEDPQMQLFQELVTDELARQLNLRVPKDIAGEWLVFYTSILVHRSQLPGRTLYGGFFPVLANPKKTDAVIILHHHYWPTALKRYWMIQKS